MHADEAHLVRLLDADPELARWLDPKAVDAARREIIVEAIALSRGPWVWKLP